MHLGLIGYGSIGRALIARCTSTQITDITVLVRRMPTEPTPPDSRITFVTTLAALLQNKPDLVIECAGHAAVAAYASEVLASGTDIVIASVGALADPGLHDALIAASTPARYILPTGAIGGLDLLRVLATASDVQVTYRGIKPPAAWKGSPAAQVTDLDALTERFVFFAGSGRDAALAYPKNANVVAALALAGAGFDTMTVELIADPGATRNLHAFDVASPLCTYTIEIANAANPDNPRTSLTTVASLYQIVADRAAALSASQKGSP